MKAVVFCGGFGTRLGALTADVAKVMLPLAGEPLLAHTLRWLRSQGVTDVGVNLHFRGDSIRACFGDGSAHGVSLVYLEETALAGTAGTLRAFRGFLGDDDAITVYGDLLIDQDLGELFAVHRARGADATLLLHQRAGSNSLVRLGAEQRITAFIERPTEEERAAAPHPWVHSGVTVVGPRLVAAIPEGAVVDLPRDVYVPGVDRMRLFGVPLSGYRCAIDSPERYAEAERAIATGAYHRA